jgi:hypothetical protein
MADQYVQVSPDSSGKKIEVSEITRSDGVVVERQRVVLGDASLPSALANVDLSGNLQVHSDALLTVLSQILGQLRLMNLQLSLMSGQTMYDPAAAIDIFN